MMARLDAVLVLLAAPNLPQLLFSAHFSRRNLERCNHRENFELRWRVLSEIVEKLC